MESAISLHGGISMGADATKIHSMVKEKRGNEKKTSG
jgi:hypothetical protein